MNRHHHFEIQCLLASCGQLTESELRELENHLEKCKDCAGRVLQMCNVNSQLVDTLNPKKLRHKMPDASDERFAERARREGIPIKLRASYPRIGINLRFAVACFLTIVLAGFGFPVFVGSLFNHPTQEGTRLYPDPPNESDAHPSLEYSAPATVRHVASVAKVSSFQVKPHSLLNESDRTAQALTPEFQRIRVETTQSAVSSSIFDRDPSKVSQIVFGFPKSNGPLSEWFRKSDAHAVMRPAQFQLNTAASSVCSEAEGHGLNSIQRNFCFNPEFAFFAR